MECKKCKVKLNDGETFCRKCATSIYVEDEVVSNQPSVSISHKILNRKEAINNKPIQMFSTPEKLDLSFVNNKDLINRGQNDEKSAKKDLIKSLTIIFLALGTLALLVAIAVSFL